MMDKRQCVRYLLTFITILFFPIVNSAAAEEHLISQKDLAFSRAIKVIKPGDQVTFLNEDNVVHNIISQTTGFQFDLGAFKPGMQRTVKFNQKSGVIDIECTVHPKMKLTVFIF
jgi:plastocyanin